MSDKHYQRFKEAHIGPEHQKFRDMRLRLINARGCVFPPRHLVSVVNEHPGDRWLYGLLYLWWDGDKESMQATFGDLTISISFEEVMVLRDIATNPDSKFAYQW